MSTGFASRLFVTGAFFCSVSLAFSGCEGSQAGLPARALLDAARPHAALHRHTAFTVTNTLDSGPGSLRAAILTANAAPPSASSIVDFATTGVITLASALPQIVRSVRIDGTSAPGYTAGGAPLVEVNAGGFTGIVFAKGSAGSTMLALSIVGAKGNGVTLEDGHITLNLNYIGLSLSGAAAGNGGDGVHIDSSSSSDAIGENPQQYSGVVGNVISGNLRNGVAIDGSSNDTVAANYIGTNPAGTLPVGNGGNGIAIENNAKSNEIGGTVYVDARTGMANDPTGDKGTSTPVFVVPPLGNLISGNREDGVLIVSSTGNALNGNFIGTSAGGNGPLGNGGNGVELRYAGNNALAGCTAVENPFVYYNVVAGNAKNGLRVTSSNDVTVQGNFFGIGANNTTPVGNRLDGIRVDGTSNNTQVGGVIPLGNVSGSNGTNGIEVTGKASSFTTFNTFGGLLAFKGPSGNRNDGVLITATGGNQTVRTNVFSGNGANGIEIGGDASGVTVDPDIVGLNTKGNGAMPNGNDGIKVDGTAHGNTIGGYTQSVIPQNTFSANLRYGVEFAVTSYGNTIFNSFVGTDVLGTKAFGNGKGGIYVSGTANHVAIGASSAAGRAQPARNLVSGNSGNGVTLARGTGYVSIIGNWIGLTRADTPLPNSGKPILVMPGSKNNTISGNKT
ncbi:MAG TPA: right-handed parallel beta-helix repeat-containing protein [Candidatus Acidoferrales bacterium]|nr:right-handed parallel beta-helix repeat-containing protein [Candidatus Acidoferrales bacterium]